MRLALVFVPTLIFGQGTVADYSRSGALRDKLQNLTVNVAGSATWIGSTNRFWYRKTVKGGAEFVVVDAATQEKRPAFDHAKVAAALGGKATAVNLPFNDFLFVDDEKAITFTAEGAQWRCTLADYACRKTGTTGGGRGGRGGGRGPAPLDDGLETPSEPENNVEDGMALEYPQLATGAPPQSNTFAAFGPAPPVETRLSPDEKWEVYLNNYNVMIRKKGEAKGERLSMDGSEGNYYTLPSISWSPDSKKPRRVSRAPGVSAHSALRRIVARRPAPAEALDPRVRQARRSAGHRAAGAVRRRDAQADRHRQHAVPQSLSLIALGVAEGRPRLHLRVQPARPPGVPRHRSGRATRQGARADRRGEQDVHRLQPARSYPACYDVEDGKEIIWVSERDGWNHLYLYDGVTGKVKNQITKGDWVVRGVERVDEEKRQIWFSAGGMHPGKDPYFVHYYRINFDGTGLDRADRGRRQSHGRVLARPASTSSTPGRASTCRR